MTMEQKNEQWERLRQVIDASRLSINAFAHSIGLPRGENLYQIQRGNNRISEDVARRIHDKYPAYSVAWLIFGEDEITVPAGSGGPVVRIPLYYDYAAMNLSSEEAPDDYLILSASVANGVELAVPYSDDILNPYLRNVLLLLRRHEPPILYGNIYLVGLQAGRLFRIVKPHDLNPELLRLTTLQPSEFGELVVPVEQIVELWSVVGAVCRLLR